ncbi:MAG: NAD(P)-dependent alcohol dehydrogenase, partial [Candidatus Bathyarchaeia archaeon]
DKILMKELDIRGVHRYANVFPTAIKLISSRKVDVKSLVSMFPLEKIVEGFKVHMDKIGSPIKVQVEV